METRGEHGPGAEPDPPPGLTSKGDQYLYRRIEEVSSGMNEIVKAVNAVPAGVDARVDAKLEPLNSRLEALGRAIDSFAKLAEDVQKIREEFTGFRSFRERIEGREKFIEDLLRKYAIWLIGVVVLGAFYLGGFLMSINGNIGEMKNSIGEVKGSIDKLQSITYEFNGTLKRHDGRLEGMDKQLNDMRGSVREISAKTATETSDKAAERIAGILDGAEKRIGAEVEQRIGKNDAALAGRLDVFERKFEEASDVLVLWLALNPGDKPAARSDTSLNYYPPVSPSQKPRAMRAAHSPSKTLLDGVVNFYIGDELFRPAGVVATAQPMKDEGRVPIQLFFRDKAALEDFEKVMGRLREDGKPMRLKVTFTLG
jgi:hypothetical protein